MRKCNKCAFKFEEQKGPKFFCFRCKEYKLKYETYKFFSISNQFNNK